MSMVLVEQLAALVVVVPLVMAPVCALLRDGRVAYAVALVTTAVVPVLAWMLAQQVAVEDVVSYAMGGWAPPWGIELRVDTLGALMALLVSSMGFLVLAYGWHTFKAEIAEDKQALTMSLYLLCLAGLMGMVVTGDAFNAFVFMEISSLATYVLIALGKDRRATVAAFQYLIMGTIGATLFIIGIGLLYAMTGTLNLADMAEQIRPVRETAPVLAALAFLLVGLSLKIALFPLHLWLPNAYAYAPSIGSAFLAATATKVSIYLLLRFVFTLYGDALVFEALPFTFIIETLSVAAMLAGSLIAIYQADFKRMLAFSSVAQVGYITLGIGLATEMAIAGGLLHVVGHALMKAALFMVAGAVLLQVGSTKIADMAGIGRKMPFTMGALIVAAMAMLGAPGTIGFVSKWYLARAALDLGMGWLVAAIMLSSILVLVYLGRVIEAAFFRAPSERAAAVTEAPVPMLVVTWLLALSCVYFGLDSSWPAGMAETAAARLLDVAP